MFFKNKRKGKIFIIVMSIIIVLIILVSLCIIYLNDYYQADSRRIEAFAITNTVKMQTIENNVIVFEPEGATNGIIFYPGGKVEYTAYIPLMKALASEGIMSVLVEMPFNLAVFDINAADGIQDKYPQIENWYIGGHSLGGSMAASYISEHKENFEGLVLLGSYSTENLSGTDLKIISIYGSEDFIMNRENYEINKINLPSDFSEIIIVGGNHAYFGMYGMQDGDGMASITNEEQIYKTASEIVALINAE